MTTGKNGSHVGIILSFVVFIAFLFFIFYILQPKLNFSPSKQSFLDSLQIEVIENISANFTVANIEFTSQVNPSQNCIVLQGFLIWAEFTTNLILVKDEAEITQTAYTVGFSGGGGSLAINRADTSKHFFNIYNSPKFSKLTDKTTDEIDDMNCAQISQTAYTIGLVKVKTEAFESEIDKLIMYYNNDYLKLKTNLNIPSDTEFGFSFKKSDGTVKKPDYKSPTNANVYTNEVPVLYVDNSGNIRSGFLTIIAW